MQKPVETTVKQPQVNTVEKVKVDSPKEVKYTLSFNPEQLSVLKEYYSWAGLEEENANKEIEELNTKLKTRDKENLYSDTVFLYEVIAKLGNNYNIAKAFGTEIGTHLVKFMAVGLPFVPSLVIKASEFAYSKPYEFYNTLFFDLMQCGNEQYGIDLECRIKDIISDSFENAVVISIPQKPNIYFVQNEWMEEECIIDGIQEIFRTLPDERIEVGDMTDSEKAEYLKLLRSDEGRNIIRDNFV